MWQQLAYYIIDVLVGVGTVMTIMASMFRTAEQTQHVKVTTFKIASAKAQRKRTAPLTGDVPVVLQLNTPVSEQTSWVHRIIGSYVSPEASAAFKSINIDTNTNPVVMTSADLPQLLVETVAYNAEHKEFSEEEMKRLETVASTFSALGDVKIHRDDLYKTFAPLLAGKKLSVITAEHKVKYPLMCRVINDVMSAPAHTTQLTLTVCADVADRLENGTISEWECTYNAQTGKLWPHAQGLAEVKDRAYRYNFVVVTSAVLYAIARIGAYVNEAPC